LADGAAARGEIAWKSQDVPARPPMLPLFGNVAPGWWRQRTSSRIGQGHLRRRRRHSSPPKWPRSDEQLTAGRARSLRSRCRSSV